MTKEMIVSSALKFRWINAQCLEFKLNNGKTLVSAVIAGYGSVGDTALDLELAYDDYVWDLYEETGVELETGTNYVGKVNIFYTNYPG